MKKHILTKYYFCKNSTKYSIFIPLEVASELLLKDTLHIMSPPVVDAPTRGIPRPGSGREPRPSSVWTPA